jgi:hypothetical protein
MKNLIFFLILALTLGCSSTERHENDEADKAMLSAEEKFVQDQAALVDTKTRLQEGEMQGNDALITNEATTPTGNNAPNAAQLQDIQLLLEKANETIADRDKGK